MKLSTRLLVYIFGAYLMAFVAFGSNNLWAALICGYFVGNGMNVLVEYGDEE